mmetsp:Transcript_77978/g.141818  ORF Transcript_77978/g.141818 Transcript_77978/m.141818 type:complete len:704 (-) Transcript_77978:119-2230(-)
MQCTTTIILLLATAIGNIDAVTIKSLTSRSHSDEKSPIYKVVNMLRDIKHQAEVNGKQNQMMFDRYSCWVERITAEKEALIEAETKDIANMKEDILKLEASRGKSIAVVKNTKQDIADNEASQKEAEEQRMKERDEYEATKEENENALGAVQAAVKVLHLTGTGGALLQTKAEHTQQEVAVMSIVNRLSSAINRAVNNGYVSDTDLHSLQVFLQRPTDFVGAEKRTLSAAQVGQQNNPFGDYAPRSDVIQGILKQMAADFHADIVKNDAAEEDAAKAFQKLMSTRQQELEALDTALEEEELSLATSKEDLANTRMNLDETIQDKKNDEQFVEDTRAASVQKSKEWNARVRFHSQEIMGIDEAIKILMDAKDLFTRSYTTFLQTSAVSTSEKSMTFAHLKQLATRSHSMRLAKIALQFKSGWHFDKVIASLDDMLKVLRDEEASDIAHKDRCESSKNANANVIDDLTAEIEKTDLKLQSLKTDYDSAVEEISALKREITNIQSDMSEILQDRNKESAIFKKANKDDTDAIAVLDLAIAALAKIQKKVSFAGLSANPVYAVDEDVAPETDFKDSSGTLYGQSNVIQILEMCKEDIKKDMATTAAEEAEAEADFDKSYKEQTKEIANRDARIATLTKQKADITADTADATEYKTMKSADLTDEGTLKQTLKSDCAWVKETFDERYKARKTEMASIVEAKEFLSGAM